MIKKIVTSRITAQSDLSMNHVGGVPVVSSTIEWPKCECCGTSMAFFLQLDLSEADPAVPLCVYLWKCVSCISWTNVLPALVSSSSGVPDHSKGLNFKVLLASNGPKLKFLEGPCWINYQRVTLKDVEDEDLKSNKLGGLDGRVRVYPNIVDIINMFEGSRFMWQIVRPIKFTLTTHAPRPLKLNGEFDITSKCYDLWADAKLFFYLCKRGADYYPYLDYLHS